MKDDNDAFTPHERTVEPLNAQESAGPTCSNAESLAIALLAATAHVVQDALSATGADDDPVALATGGAF